MYTLKTQKVTNESHILDALKKLKEEQIIFWNWVSEGEDKKRQIIESYGDFREILLDIIKFLHDSEIEIKKQSNFFGAIRDEVKPHISKIKEINTLVETQVKRFQEEIKKNQGMPSQEILISILNQEKDHGAEFSKLSTLLDEAIKLGEELNTVNKNWYEISNENLDYNAGVDRYVDEQGIANFGLPKDIFNARIENEALYKFWFWTSASVVYSKEQSKVKLILSKNKEINKLLDYDLIKDKTNFLPAQDSCSYDNVKVENKEVFEFDCDENLPEKIKAKIIEGVNNFQNNYKYPNFNVYMPYITEIPTSQWRPLFVADFYDSVVFANYNLVNEGRFLFLKGPSGD
jgi:hypothetical protein